MTASKGPGDATQPLVVIERQEFVDLLARYKFLTEERDSLVQIVDAQRKQLDTLREDIVAKDEVIEQLKSQIADSESRLAIVEEERKKLQSQAKSDGIWDTIKNYLLIFLGGITAAAVLL